MASERAPRRDLLKRLLRIARGQSLLFAENRLAELADSIIEREEIISAISVAGEPNGREEAALIKEILAHDANLRASIEVALEETRSEFQRLSCCNTAHSAYISGQVKMNTEGSSRDG